MTATTIPDLITVEGLQVPDLRPHFKHLHWRPMKHSMGVPVASDWADKAADDPVVGLYKNCGLWTMGEAAILYNAAKAVGGDWLDIGCHTGWTTAYLASALPGRSRVLGVDPMLRLDLFALRFTGNLLDCDVDFKYRVAPYIGTSSEYFAQNIKSDAFSGVVIDGDHNHPCPLEDAQNAATHLKDRGVILFHDFIGRPVQIGVEYLLDQGFKVKPYFTPHMVACCWRGDFEPPEHIRDPRIDWGAVTRLMPDFDFSRCV